MTTTPALPPGNGDWWKYVMAGSGPQQQQQDQGSGMGSGQTAGAQKPWTHDMGSPMNDVQQWMMVRNTLTNARLALPGLLSCPPLSTVESNTEFNLLLYHLKSSPLHVAANYVAEAVQYYLRNSAS